jgi:hypothetical protein
MFSVYHWIVTENSKRKRNIASFFVCSSCRHLLRYPAIKWKCETENHNSLYLITDIVCVCLFSSSKTNKAQSCLFHHVSTLYKTLQKLKAARLTKVKFQHPSVCFHLNMLTRVYMVYYSFTTRLPQHKIHLFPYNQHHVTPCVPALNLLLKITYFSLFSLSTQNDWDLKDFLSFASKIMKPMEIYLLITL